MVMKSKWVIILLFISSISLANEFSINVENDFIVGTDNYYTHGTRLNYLYDGSFPIFDNIYKDKNKSVNFSLGQYIYTPHDKKATEPILDDRPYCGLLYIGLSLLARDNIWCDYWEFDFGTVGPNSLAEESQNTIHKWIGSAEAMGWDNQIRNELGFNLIYQKKYRWRWNDTFDVIPHAGGCVGNFFDYANGGAFTRLGWNLPDDFGLVRMEPTARVMNGGFWDNFSLFGYAECDNRYVLRNISLDGNTWKDSQSIKKESYVRDFEYGISMKAFWLTLTYGQNNRTKEFSGQPHQESFATAVITFLF